ncbi:MAG TPA: BrnT family toxin, partial [Alphaproteobacteria bacterium]|nr:BrnT family toxin [Alphaproteobacteria bacterium]
MFEWDENKRRKNRERRGLDFEDVDVLFAGRPLVTALSPRHDENRFVSTGEMDGKFYTVVWTWRGENQRIISFRR